MGGGKLAENALPDGWVRTPIRDITCVVSNAKPENDAERDFGYVDIASIDNTTFTIGHCKRFAGIDAPSRARRLIQADDVLFSNVRTYLRNIALVPKGLDAQLCSTGFTVLRSNGAVEPRFLFRYVLTEEFLQSVTPQQTGTHYPATSDRIILGEEVPLPPLAEQRRIVAKVEELLGRVNAARDRLAKVPSLVKRFRQSVLAAACSGQLTQDWREANVGEQTANDETDEIEQERFSEWRKVAMAKAKAEKRVLNGNAWHDRYERPTMVSKSNLFEIPES